MPNNSASHLTPPDLSPVKDYQLPCANDLVAALPTDVSVSPGDSEGNSRESTPSLNEPPFGVDHWKLAARAAICELEKILGTWAAYTTRQTIPDSHYWKTEANQYEGQWILAIVQHADPLIGFRPASVDQIRDKITDLRYWRTETKHYEHWMALTGHTKEPKKRPSQSPSGICKRKKTLHPISRVSSEVEPVSSRLRGGVEIEEGRAKLINTFNGTNASKETRL